MWNQLAAYKNTYLQKKLPFMKPVAINPMVEEGFALQQVKRNKCKYPTEKPECCQSSTYFDDHAQLAYGFRALPKLLRELCSDDLKIQWRAINSLSEFLLNPVNAQRAIREADIIRILKNAFLRHRLRYLKQKYREVDQLLECFRVLSVYSNAATDIANRTALCEEFYNIVLDGDKKSELAAAILRNISEKSQLLLHLIKNTDSFRIVRDVFFADKCRPRFPYDFWIHLSHFLEIEPDVGITLGFFEFLKMRIEKRFPDYNCVTMKCFALIIRCPRGQCRFDAIDGISLLYNVMSDEMEALCNYEYIVLAFLHGMQSKHAMRRCSEFVNLPKIMTKYALKRTHCNDRMQLYALKALRKLGELPSMKAYMRINCAHNLSSRPCLNMENDCERQKLVRWLEHEYWGIEDDHL